MSAVSNRVMPRSIALWITLREASKSMRWPKLLQPRPTAETRRPELPRLRISIDESLRNVRRSDLVVTPHASARAGRWSGGEQQGQFLAPSGARCKMKRCQKKTRPRSGAATDGDRLGAHDL